MEVTTIGLDLGKDVFQVHGITDDGTVVFNRTIRRRQLLNFFETLPCCLVGIEACGSAHHWARELIEIGHDVRLMPAVYVKPYVKRGKTDAVDAEAICEAVTRPTMRFVAVKSKEQQALLTIHRVRQLIVRQKTQMLNVIRGLLREFGHVIGNGPVAAMRFIKAFQTDNSLDMPDVAKSMLKTLCEQVIALDERVTFYDKLIEYHARIDERDNRMIERLWRSLKYECVYLNAFETGSQMRAGIGKWLTYYNSERPHSTHGILTPDEAYDSKTEQMRLAA